ncbi:MAG: ABC transporter ATP-binding protein [Spirochaetes bacterium]|nr:ABC transporter ATP-binding protein [Spirochaetota bacterium]
MLKLSSTFVEMGDFSLGPINLEIPEGIIGIAGPNGSGKTTLLKTILGLVPNSKGKIEYSGIDLSLLTQKNFSSKMAYIPQEIPKDINFSLETFAAMGNYRNNRHYYKNIEKTVDDVLNEVDLIDKKKVIFSNLSGGEKKRAFIARALIQDTEWILMDEPVSFLDYRHNIIIAELIKKLNTERNKSFLIVSHQVDFLYQIASYYITIKKGAIYNKGKKEMLTEDFLSKLFEAPFVLNKQEGRILVKYN